MFEGSNSEEGSYLTLRVSLAGFDAHQTQNCVTTYSTWKLNRAKYGLMAKTKCDYRV